MNVRIFQGYLNESDEGLTLSLLGKMPEQVSHAGTIFCLLVKQ
jgi:hypothetical protein